MYCNELNEWVGVQGMPSHNLGNMRVFLDLEADVDWDDIEEEDEVDDLGM